MCEKIQLGLIKTTHVSLARQIANIFTKSFDSLLFHTLLHKLGTLDIYALVLGGVLEFQNQQQLKHNLWIVSQ